MKNNEIDNAVGMMLDRIDSFSRLQQGPENNPEFHLVYDILKNSGVNNLYKLDKVF
jgi:hypothetical protein